MSDRGLGWMFAETIPAGSPPSEHRPRTGPGRGAVFLVTLLAVTGSVGWRRGEYFSGGFDVVVVAKAAVTVLAVSLSFLMLQSTAPRRRLGTGSLWLLGLLLGCSVLGAVTADQLLPGVVVAVRVGMLATVVVFLLRAAPAHQVLGGIAAGSGAVAALAALTGVPGMVSGRLAGGLPAMDPNELALLAGIAVVFLGWRAVIGEAGWRDALAAAFFFAIMWETGSRTALLMVLLAVVVMGLHLRRARVGLVVGGLVLAALVVTTAVASGSVADFLGRDGTGASTLGSRFIAWRAALDWAESSWQTLFGGGLSVKIIRVYGQWWDTQPLDSSWVSLLVQAGVVGLTLAAGWALWVVRGAFRAPYAHRVLYVGLLVFLVGRSLLESGLFDASPAFLLFLAISLLAEGGSRARLRAEADPA